MAGDNGGLDALVAALVESTQKLAVTRHVGRINRLFHQREQIYVAIEADSNGDEALRNLLHHPGVHVQLDIARHCLWRDICKDDALAQLNELSQRTDQIGRDAQWSLQMYAEPREASISPSAPLQRPRFPFKPKPKGFDRSAVEDLIRRARLARAAPTLIALLRPAIRIWPQPKSADPLASRFGGMPMVPPEFAWPSTYDEPFWFLAQINCAELGPCANAFGLPSEGLLSFFGDHDDVNGCTPAGGGKAYYFSDVSLLRLAALPLDDFEPQMACGMGFFETYELPHAYEPAIESFDFSDAQTSAYIDLRLYIAQLGTPHLWKGRSEISKLMDGYEISKLFGWPDHIQIGLIEMPEPHEPKLLLQLGGYCDGQEHHGWGPGGLLYFTLHPRDLEARRFERAELIVQCS